MRACVPPRNEGVIQAHCVAARGLVLHRAKTQTGQKAESASAMAMVTATVRPREQPEKGEQTHDMGEAEGERQEGSSVTSGAG